ncbi:GCN5-related N-acetyltransferase [Desulfosarcina cetonica]|uniref:GNAT family N-acetyltransferase n=1 Tax=Desulfosarcina cetonica TaxID=90730 RepID=UPI0006CFC07F|nr:GNAT family N-acetyltransferase [Desulfosarcina cetonica]VTR65983.1 GCN5-related N-acetyltransferase [Desulfosarcina cetonica]
MIEYTFLENPTQTEIARLTELYRLAGWWKDAADHPSTVAGIVRGSHCFLAARQGGTIVGMGRAISDRISDAYIQDVTVDPAFRHQGIGSRMVAQLVARLEADGIGWIGLIAERKTHPFYRPLGFAPMADSVPMLKTL